MKQVPNILSVLRIILAPIFVVMYLQDELVWRSLSIAVFATAAITDYFDGYLARYYRVESASGVFLDPLADKILTFSGFIVLPLIDPQMFPLWAIILIIIRDVVVTGMRVLANYRNITMRTRFTAKLKTFSQMVFLYAAILMGVFIKTDITLGYYARLLYSSNAMEWLLYLITAITVYSGLEYIIHNRSLFQSQPSHTPKQT